MFEGTPPTNTSYSFWNFIFYYTDLKTIYGERIYFNSLSELLEYYLSNKNPFKSKTEIKKLLKNKKEGILLEEEWKGIINYIYSEEDADIIQNKIINYIKKKK